MSTRLPTQPETVLRQTLAQLPSGPGIYRFYDAHHKLLYVGKAKNLKHRISSYFNNRGRHALPRTEALVARIDHVEPVLTQNEHEAFILEDNLIKTHRPPYNIALKDNHRYPWITMTDEAFPRIVVTRRMQRQGKRRSKAGLGNRHRGKVFGPFSDVSAMWTMIRMIRQHFPLRQRPKPLFRDRPCMNYSIGTCPAPCQDMITAAEYDRTLDQVQLLLKGRPDALLDKIHADMVTASADLNFEWAAKLRDRYQAVERLLAGQQSVNLNDVDVMVDVVGVAHDDLRCALVVWRVRGGRLVDSTTHQVQLAYGARVEEALDSFLPQFYADQAADQIPDEVLVPYAPAEGEEREMLASFLTESRLETPTTLGDTSNEVTFSALSEETRLAQRNKRRSAVIITVPKRGTRKELLDGATRNAQEALRLMQTDAVNHLQRDPTSALHQLQQQLGLPTLPLRMECYDISHVQGTNTVASMVVLTNGQPDKAEYRQFNIRSAEGAPDDFASMHEALTRRARHMADSTNSDAKHNWPTPDLIIIDGGKGQLSAARAAMEATGIGDIATISLAKRLEEVFFPNNSSPLVLPRDSTALFLLQQIRDEAHRFAITRHRGRRGKSATQSVLDSIPGIGPKRKAQLLARFSSLQALHAASLETLHTTGGLSLSQAQAVYDALHPAGATETAAP